MVLAGLAALWQAAASAPILSLPDRPADALGGAAFAAEITNLPLEAREDRIYREVLKGNIPNFERQMVAVPVATKIAGGPHGVVYVTPDYLAIGSDADYLLIPMTPYTAQRIADRLRCLLPTPKISDAIYAAAAVKLTPSPIPPTPAMVTVPVFVAENQAVGALRRENPAPRGALTAGDKKDIVVCKALADSPGHVAIYGWHKPDAQPIQPLYLGHIATWADYSHGVRLVASTMLASPNPSVPATARRVLDVFRDPVLCPLISDEGPILQPRYVFHHWPHAEPWTNLPTGEWVQSFSPMPGVRALTDAPPLHDRNDPPTPPALVIYALPNGNTIEETFGRRRDPDDSPRFDIQQIAAQTRFVRKALRGQPVIVVYLEASGHSWPAWLRGKDPSVAKEIVDRVRDHVFSQGPPSDANGKITLMSHSGGGALIFDYIRAVDAIPASVDRIAFLDSEYDYERDACEGKLAVWLKDPAHTLCAIAYDDANALYNGKPFVTPAGGTWGRTHAMLADLQKEFAITRVGDGDPERWVGAAGRLTFLLKENPTHAIFHTVQVERNGFIEGMLCGTPFEEKGYRYFGGRAYSRYVQK